MFRILVDHKNVVEELNGMRTDMRMILNTNIQKYSLNDVLCGKFINKSLMYVSKIDNLIIIELMDRKSKHFDGKIVLKVEDSVSEDEFKLNCLEYYTSFQETINRKMFPGN